MTTWTAPPADRVAEPMTGPERAMLQGWLDWHRQTLLTKCAGLTAEQLKTAAVPPSTLTLLGLVRHMTLVEQQLVRPGHRHRGDLDLRHRTTTRTATSTTSPTRTPRPTSRRTRRSCRRRPQGRRASISTTSSSTAQHQERALGLPAHDRGVRPPQRPRRPAARAHRRRHRRLTWPIRPAGRSHGPPIIAGWPRSAWSSRSTATIRPAAAWPGSPRPGAGRPTDCEVVVVDGWRPGRRRPGGAGGRRRPRPLRAGPAAQRAASSTPPAERLYLSDADVAPLGPDFLEPGVSRVPGVFAQPWLYRSADFPDGSPTSVLRLRRVLLRRGPATSASGTAPRRALRVEADEPRRRTAGHADRHPAARPAPRPHRRAGLAGAVPLGWPAARPGPVRHRRRLLPGLSRLGQRGRRPAGQAGLAGRRSAAAGRSTRGSPACTSNTRTRTRPPPSARPTAPSTPAAWPPAPPPWSPPIGPKDRPARVRSTGGGRSVRHRGPKVRCRARRLGRYLR